MLRRRVEDLEKDVEAVEAIEDGADDVEVSDAESDASDVEASLLRNGRAGCWRSGFREC